MAPIAWPTEQDLGELRHERGLRDHCTGYVDHQPDRADTNTLQHPSPDRALKPHQIQLSTSEASHQAAATQA